MGWKKNFKCQINYFAHGKTHTWSGSLPLPESIPLQEILWNESTVTSKSLKKELTLEHRKALWVYQNIDQKIWKKLTKSFEKWLSRQPDCLQMELEVHEAATPVILQFLSQTKLKNKIKVVVHKAPLAWLESEFSRTRKKNISLSLADHPMCPWSGMPKLSGKLAA